MIPEDGIYAMINVLLSPLIPWKPRPIPSCQAPDVKRAGLKRSRDWEDIAVAEDWAQAVLGFLRQRRKEAVPLWEVVNAVAQASTQPDRWETRFATTQILLAVKLLIRDRRVLRYRRRFLAVLDTGEESIPLDVYYALPIKTATGRTTADSTRKGEVVKSPQNSG